MRRSCATTTIAAPMMYQPIGFPDCRDPELDVRPWWEPRRVDAPALHLPPIEGRHDSRLAEWDVLRPRAVENLTRKLSDASSDRAIPFDHAAHDTGAEKQIEGRSRLAPERPWSTGVQPRPDTQPSRHAPACSERRKSSFEREPL